jgi:uncharacterized protein YycO
MKVLLFKGKGVISRSIRWQTDGVYSHAAILLDDGKTIVEAWHTGTGVRKKILKDWTNIDVYEIPCITQAQKVKVELFLNSQLGKGYDYWGILRFLTRRDRNNPEKWFCSELVVAALWQAGIELFAPFVPAYKVSPELISYSPRIFCIQRTVQAFTK